MLAELKFVAGAVAKKDFIPELTHFCIENNTVRGYNGVIALCSPIPFDIACKPKAIPLVAAIRACSETVTLALTPTGRLSIKSGKFKALIECTEGETPHVSPEGERLEINGEAFLKAIQAVEPFIGTDASRPWANGVLLKGQSAFATNNVVLVEYWTGFDFPKLVNLPRAAIKEILRIGEPPLHVQASENSFSLHFSGERWIRSSLLSTEWPALDRVLNRPSDQKPLDPRIFDGIESIKPFADKMGRAYFHNGTICTSKVDGEGSSFELENAPVDGLYNMEMLALLQGTANTIDFSTYPDPCLFYGDVLRGAIIGMRQ